MNLPVRVIPDKVHKDMYRLQWEDGSISVGTTTPKPWEKGGHYGFYNLSRANDILRNYDQYRYNMKKGDPAFNNLRAFVRAEKL